VEPMAGRIVVGTSSWADPGFVEDWYPPGLPARDRLAWYAERFEAVELNSSFYALPSRRTAARWVELTPAGFRFHVKLHRLLSRHAAPLDSLPPDLRDEARTNERGRVLLDPTLERALAARLLEEVAPLAQAGRLGAFMLQLSPAFTPDRHELGELAGVTEALAPWPVAVELRHRAWVATRRRERTLAELEALGAAFVGVDSPQGRSPVRARPGAAKRSGAALIKYGSIRQRKRAATLLVRRSDNAEHLDANYWRVPARGQPVQPSACADARPGQP